MATSSKGYALTGVLAGGRRRSNNPLVKQAPNAAGPVVVDDTLFSASVSGAHTLTCLGGSYTLTGGNASVLRSKRITANGGSYTTTGRQATLLRSKRLVATGGSYVINGQSAAIYKSKYVTASGGVYTVSGQQAILNRNRFLVASSGIYTLTGSTVVFTKSSAGGYPAEADVRLGVIYGASGEYTGTLDVGKKFRLDIATGNVVMVLDGGKVMTL